MKKSILLMVGFVWFVLIWGSNGARLTAQERAVPAREPDVAAGLEIFAARCANCHGDAGLGNGALAANLPNRPSAIGSLNYWQTAVPEEMFHTISNGRVERGMPPFGETSSNPIDEQARWDLIAALYSMAHSAISLNEGAQLYNQNCASCHGDGPELELSELSKSVSEMGMTEDESEPIVYERELVDLEETLASVYIWGKNTEQIGEEWGALSGHETIVSVDNLWLIVDYLRIAGYNYVDMNQFVNSQKNVTVSGTVLNGTTNSPVAEGRVALRAYNQNLEQMFLINTPIDQSGQFHFQIPMIDPNWFFGTRTTFQTFEFSSSFDQIDLDSGALLLPIEVYETTVDDKDILIEQIHIVVEFFGEQMQVSELYLFSNEGNQLYVGDEQGTLKLSLPDGVSQPRFQRGFGSFESFRRAPEVEQVESQLWIDTQAVYPGLGQTILLVQYEMAYQDGMKIEHSLPYQAINSSLIIPDSGVSLVENSKWIEEEPANIEGVRFNSYTGSSYEVDEELSLVLTGKLKATDQLGNRLYERDERQELMIGSGILLLTLLGLIYWWRSVQGRRFESERTAYLIALAELEDRYSLGELSESRYREDRLELISWLLDDVERRATK